MANGFNWYELMTDDVEGAKSFYASVVGWEMRGFDGSVDYTILEADGRGIGGMMATPPEARTAGAWPTWLGYIEVDDVEAALADVTRVGGSIHRDMMRIPGVGDIAPAADPQGAAFYLIAPIGEDQPAADPMTPRHVGWHELRSSDWESGFSFYSGQFGWEKDEAMNMGPMGTYQLFRAGGSNAVGGMFNAPQQGRPAWLFYFVVQNIDEAAERVRSAGGEVLEGPMEVPGGAWTIEAKDPQGAMFALVGMRL